MAFSMAWLRNQVEGKTGDDRARGLLAAFRGELYRCFATYRDALLELADAVLCKRTGCTCWRSCRWSRSTAAATARCMAR